MNSPPHPPGSPSGPSPAGEPDLFETVARLRREAGRGVLATVVSTRGSTPGKVAMRLLVYEDGRFEGSVGGGCVEAEVVADALAVLVADAPRRATYRLTERETGDAGLACGGELEVFFEPVTAPALLVLGAGHVAKDLCPIAARAGFRVTVADDRPAFAHPDRFPEAQAVLSAPSFEALLPTLRVTSATWVVVVTRGHAMDLACLDFALHTPAPYVGLIGSQRKVRAILGRLGAAGRLDGVDLGRLHAPIGLALGGDSHGEIALAIAAELVAFRRRTLSDHRACALPQSELERLARTGRAPAAPSAATPGVERTPS